MPTPTYSDLRKLLGKRPVAVWPGDPQAEAALEIVTAMAKSYTRDQGFVDGVPNDDLKAVILKAAARLIAHPGQIRMNIVKGLQAASFGDGFSGWTLAELAVLNRCRVRAQ